MKNLLSILDRSAKDLKFELVDFQWFEGQSLRVYIEKSNRSVNTEDCHKMSDYLSKVLNVENIKFKRLEVSSPGMRRKINKNFDLHLNKRIKLKLKKDSEHPEKVLTAILTEVEEDSLVLGNDDSYLRIKLSEISSANLAPDFKALLKAGKRRSKLKKKQRIRKTINRVVSKKNRTPLQKLL